MYSWTEWKEKHTLLILQLRSTPDGKQDIQALKFLSFVLIAEEQKKTDTPGTHVLQHMHTVRGKESDHGSYFGIWQIYIPPTHILLKKVSVNEVNLPYCGCRTGTATIERKLTKRKHLKLFLSHDPETFMPSPFQVLNLSCDTSSYVLMDCEPYLSALQ